MAFRQDDDDKDDSPRFYHSLANGQGLLHPSAAMDIALRRQRLVEDSDDHDDASHDGDPGHGHDAAVQQGRTLLPFPFAQAVTLSTRSASLFLRLGTSIGGYTFHASKAATLSGFDLGRVVVEGILSRAGKDLLATNSTEFGRAETENLLERGLATIHRTITGAAFLTATSFQLVETTASSVHEVTQLLLSFADQLLGSTESSRAIASIFTLIRREFQNPATGAEGERVGIIDLFLGLCGMAYLQRWCGDLIEEENRKLEVEEVVWDVVVATGGERYALHQDSLYGVHNGNYTRPADETLPPDHGGADMMSMIQNHSAQQSSDSDEDLPEIHLKQQILRSLPDDAKVSIMTETTTSKIITVDIQGASPPPLSPPPGAKLLEHGPSRPRRSSERRQDGSVADGSSYRFVYRVDRNTFCATDFRRNEGATDFCRNEGELEPALDEEPVGFVEQLRESSSDGDDSTDDEQELRPPVPPKSPATLVDAASRIPQPTSPAVPMATPSRTSQLPVSKPSPESANQKRQRTPLKASSSSIGAEPTPSKPPMKRPRAEQAAKSTDHKKGGFRTALKKGPGPALSNLLRKESSDNEGLPRTSFRRARTAPASSATPGYSTFTQAKPLQQRQPRQQQQPPQQQPPQQQSHVAVPGRLPSMIPRREAPPPPNKAAGSSGKVLARQNMVPPEAIPRSLSRTSYVAVHERKRDSLVSQSDTFSIHTIDSSRPISPTLLRGDLSGSMASASGRSHGAGRPSMSKSRSDRDISDHNPFVGSPSSPGKHHRRVRSQNPSIYTLKTSDSQTSLVLSSYFTRSAYGDTDALNGLRRTGMVQGMFPRGHLLRNITRYMLFSSASYGSSFLKVMGISKKMSLLQVLDDDTHHELTSYAHHTESEANSILLSSFVDPQGGSDSTGATNTGVPLVHYISIDKEAKAVVLACRGTLGFEDVLADMTCDYDDLLWRGRHYKVHKGIHASARRLLYGGDGRVLATLKAALEEYPEYGLVLCGHSLGGGVTALLGVMLSEPAATGACFVTSGASSAPAALPSSSSSSSSSTPATSGGPGSSERTTRELRLPAGRPIHVFAYGPPGTMSASLRKATRGLITSVVQGNDLVPHLSLGVLHDLQAVALAIKNDNIDAKMELRQRLWAAFQDGLARSWYHNSVDDDDGPGSGSSSSGGGGGGGGCSNTGGGGGGNEGGGPAGPRNPDKKQSGEDGGDDTWAFAALKTLRANMMSTKLLPPGEVLTIETTRVMRRDAFIRAPGGGGVAGGAAAAAAGAHQGSASGRPPAGAEAEAAAAAGFYLGRPARRVVLKYVRDVETRFREVRFAGTMLTDHSPGRYEDALKLLQQGVMPL
ncbi:hypothetical protein RB596_009519 [Gaeumannomyces avenae]